MGDMDQTPPYRKAKIEMAASKRTMDSKAPVTDAEIKEMEKDPLMKKLLEPVHQKPKLSLNQNISVGQVNMSIPLTWVRSQLKENQIGNDRLEEYLVGGDPKATLSFYYRGRRCSEAAGKDFLKILNAPPHELSKTEFGQLFEITRNKREDRFTKTSARTVDIRSKRVLIVAGSFDKGKPGQVDNKTIYIDSDGTGTAVQEIYFQAPPASFKIHANEVDEVFKSITWK